LSEEEEGQQEGEGENVEGGQEGMNFKTPRDYRKKGGNKRDHHPRPLMPMWL
jgi:hypothetical protein